MLLFLEPNEYKMNKFLLFLQLTFVITSWSLSSLAQADKRYASDQVEVLLRTGPSHQHAIVRMLKSGVALEVLERDKSKGYSKVRTTAGTEGWVLTRHLMAEPSARELLEKLSDHFSKSEDKPDNPGAQANLVKLEYDALAKRALEFEKDNKRMEGDLAKIKQTAANAVRLDSENQEMRQQIVDLNNQLSKLEQENNLLSSQIERDWFYAGALVLFIGLFLGLVIPRIQWRSRSRYSDFQ
jgi:SH3 domain protein